MSQSPLDLVHQPKYHHDALEFHCSLATRTPAPHAKKAQWLTLVIDHRDIRCFDARTLQGKKMYSVTPGDSNVMANTTLIKHFEAGQEATCIAIVDWKSFGEPIRIQCPQWGTGDRWVPVSSLIKGRFRNRFTGIRWAYRAWKEVIYHYFTGPDGVEYLWKTSEDVCELFHASGPIHSPVASVSDPTRISNSQCEHYKRQLIMSFNQRATTLDLDMVIITFLIVDNKRIRKFLPNLWNYACPPFPSHCHGDSEEKLNVSVWRRAPPFQQLTSGLLVRDEQCDAGKTCQSTTTSIPSSPHDDEPPSSVYGDDDDSDQGSPAKGLQHDPYSADDEASHLLRLRVRTVRFEDEKETPPVRHEELLGAISSRCISRPRSGDEDEDASPRGNQGSLSKGRAAHDINKTLLVRRRCVSNIWTADLSDNEDYPIHIHKRHISPKHAARRSKSQHRSHSLDDQRHGLCDAPPKQREGERDEESSAPPRRIASRKYPSSLIHAPYPPSRHRSTPSETPSLKRSSHWSGKRSHESALIHRRQKVQKASIYHVPASNQPLGPFVPSSRRPGRSAVGMFEPPKVKIRCVFPSPERGTRCRPIFGHPGPLQSILKKDVSDVEIP